MRGILMTLCAAALTMLLACGQTKAVKVERFELHGVIQSLDPSAKSATIKHHEIKGFMGAMTMEFPVKDADEYAKLRTGETIDATVFVQDTDVWIGEIKESK